MIRAMEGLPDNVVGFEAVGEVDAGDYKTVMEPAVKATLDNHDKVRLLYVLGNEFEGYTGGAMWEDTKIGLGHLNRWERIAVVTDSDKISHGIKTLGWLVPGDLKLFATDQLDAAKEWVAG